MFKKGSPGIATLSEIVFVERKSYLGCESRRLFALFIKKLRSIIKHVRRYLPITA